MATTNSPPLHLQNYSDAPEVVPDQGSGLEPVVHSTLEHHPGYDASPELWTKKQDAATPAPASPTENSPALGTDDVQAHGETAQNKKRRRRKWFVLGGIAIVLAIVAIVLGCVLGLRHKK